MRVYYNLHRHCLSIKHNGIVIAYIDEIKLQDTRFIVSASGRQRVRGTGRKNVHAYVEGVPVIWTQCKPRKRCTYNPYLYESFVTRTHLQPIQSAQYCQIIGKQIFAA